MQAAEIKLQNSASNGASKQMCLFVHCVLDLESVSCMIWQLHKGTAAQSHALLTLTFLCIILKILV